MTGTVFFGSNEYAVGERDGFVSVTVVRTGDTSGAVNVNLATNPSSATAGADYTTTHTVAVIAAGETSVTVDIPILDDGLSESTEAFAVTIESIDSGTLLFPRNTVVKILDDENPATDPAEPPLESDYDVTTSDVITGLDQPMSIVWLPGSDSQALLAQKKGQILVVDTETGGVTDVLIDLNAEVNSNSDRGLMDIVIHPDFENNPYLYAFYVVDPPGAAGTGGNDGEDGDGNRFAHVVRWELDMSGGTPTLVEGSKEVILGAGGQFLTDISGNGDIDSTLLENIDQPSSEIDPNTGEYKQDYIKVDSITHAGGALAFGPDGMLYVAVGDGASFNFVDPRAVSVQDVDSLSGKILRVDPMTGQGLADNPFATGDLDANASKVWMYGLRNPFTMTFAEDGRLFMSETGWYTYEEINAGGAGSNFGWPYYEGADLGNLYQAPGYQDLPGASDFYDQVNAGSIVITPAYRSFSHFDEDPGFQVNAIVGASSIYTGNRYPSEFLNDYFFTDIVEGEIYAVDINDRTKLKFVTDIGDFGPSQFVQGPDGYMYLLDLISGRMLRLEIHNETPQITSNSGGANAAINVAENTAAVTTVVADDPDSITVVYTIDGGADAAKFEIDAGTGVLSFKSPPDFEAPTDAGANNTYEVIVRASDGNTSDTQTIVVTVTNASENNNDPVITSNGGGATASVNVAENTTAVTTVTATDADPGTTIAYSLAGGLDQARFSIDPTTGALTFKAGPNFEASTDSGANNVYDVIVRASDGSRTDTQAIAVTVTNANEAPAITSNGGGSSASVSVGENAAAVTTVTSTDPDAGATRTFSISGGVDAAKFTINSSTGALTFVSAPNFEAPTDSGGNNVYDVIVKVTDNTGLSDTQAIAVTVTNINEPPSITSNGGGSAAAASANENTTAVTTVTATDADAGATRTYALDGGADAAKFEIDANTGALKFKTAPNFEAPTDSGGNNVYDVIVKVTDDTGLSDTQAIAVTVTNVNEAPVISSNGGGATAAISIVENATAVTTVTATDVDAGATRTYSISGGADQAKFDINASTGALTFKTAPNFEAPTDSGNNNVYEVTVQVSDGSLTDTQALSVTVTNVNEHTPVITSNGGGGSTSVSVAENTTAVTTVAATDADAGASLTYSITGGADQTKFTINASTGVLAFISAPDYEVRTDVGSDNIYDVTVQVSDGTRTDTQTIAIAVTNVIETAPSITSNGGGATAAILVSENTVAVTTVVASQGDSGLPVTYAISGGLDAARFEINTTTGAVRFKTAPDFETPADSGGNNVYDVIVRASDGTSAGTQAIAVTVTNQSDSPPAIVSNGGGATAIVTVVESSTAVTKVLATDPDAGTSLTYSIAGGADRSRFVINVATGALAFVAPPDFEAPKDVGGNNVYDVQVQVSDGALIDVQSIAVVVANRNEAPKITSNGGQASATVSVKENVAAVATITGSDPDASASLTFAIVGGADAERFAIDATTGALSFVKAANFEMPTDANLDNRYQVTVEVSDGLLAARQSLLVAVTDVAGKSISGSKYRDTLRAADGGESAVRGGNDKDVLLGTEWDEHLDGGKGKDKLFGGNGRDILDGGRDKDLLVGGPHEDAFRFTSKPGPGNVDKIKDFSPYYDRIELGVGVFPALKVGVLEANAFRIGSKAADADDRIIYDLVSGALFYDRDGNGAASQIKFAVLANKPEKLHEGDFLIV